MLPSQPPPDQAHVEAAAHSDDHPGDDPLELLRHDLKAPLTALRAQTQFLLRRLARLKGLDETERAWVLERGALIDAAIMAMVVRIEQLGREPPAKEDVRTRDGEAER